MTFEESIPIAKELAENQLKKGFDVEAFLILAEINKINQEYDLVPESNVDETIMDIQGLFVNYMHNRNIDNLETLLSTIRKMLK